MKTFFILSHGRTGTKFLAKMLNECDGAVVHHEPLLSDKNLVFYSYAKVFSNALSGMLSQRFEKLMKDAGSAKFYGECNSYLRYEGEWLRQNLEATVIYICRDGRDFVRSAYPRKLYTDLEPQLAIIPMNGTHLADQWAKMSRFERICWYWTDTYERLWNDSNGNIHHIEDLLSNYSLFSKVILEPTGLSISEEQWGSSVNKPENSTSGNIVRKRLALLLKGNGDKGAGVQLPEWSEWTEEQRQQFNNICGPTMKKLGYEVV